MAKKIQAEGDYIDGIGMQSHMHAVDFGRSGSAHQNNDSNWNSYADAIDKFSSLGLDVQITELDISTEGGKWTLDQQANRYKNILKAVRPIYLTYHLLCSGAQPLLRLIAKEQLTPKAYIEVVCPGLPCPV